jgi:hypothetical protein
MVDTVDAAPTDQATEAGRLAQESKDAFLAAERTMDPTDKAEALEKAQMLARQSELASAYTHLQQVVGIIAVLLPFVVAIGNHVYRACGAVIVASIVLVVASNVVDPPSSWHALFWLESVGVVAFGISWLVKGYAPQIWADRQRT